MCGIAGFWDLPQQAETCRQILEGMTATLAHRGPDGSGVTISGRCGLGHTRLSIIDLATGQQPMSDAEQSVWLTFNGEIFNHVELRHQLMARGRRFRTTSDTEVIIQLYCEFGLDFIHHLNGDFAFGLWDARRRRLLLARDRMGVRPLFYTRVGAGLAFASEVKALLATPGVHAELDPIALDQIFTTWAPIAPRTIFRNILELPPGHILVASDDGVDVKRYWRLEFPRAADVASTNSSAALQDECRALLADATRIRLRADVPVGAYLSGGLDSTIVTALARDLGVKDLRTFSVTFDDAEFDESAFQQAAAQALGTQHTAVACSAALIASTLPDVIGHAERPILRTAPAPLYTLSDRVQRDGLKVVLTGEGADEVFAGYDIFKEAKLRRFCGRQPGSRWRPLLLRRLYPYLPKLQKQSPQFLSLFFGSEADSVMDPLYSHLPRFRTTGRAKAFFSADLKAELAGYDALADLRASLPEDFRFWHPLSQAQYLEATHLLPGYILSAQGDRVAMAHGVEGRFPFLDHRVVEFAARIPPELKLRGLREKHILRECMSDITPREIIDRPKQPYRAPDAALMMAGGSTAGQIFDPAAIKSSGVFDPAAVARLVAKGARSASLGFSDSAALIGVATTELWNRQFIGADRSAPPTRAHQAALSQKVNP